MKSYPLVITYCEPSEIYCGYDKLVLINTFGMCHVSPALLRLGCVLSGPFDVSRGMDSMQYEFKT